MLQENQIRNSPNDRVEKYANSPRGTGFETLNDFSDWLETQLKSLEAKHQDFATLSSVRSFLKR